MRKLLWVVVSGLMVLSLLLAACGPAATTTPTTPTATTTPTVAPTTPTTPAAPAAQPAQKEAVAPAAGTPKYGGTYTEVVTIDPRGFDPLIVQTNSCPTLQVTQDTLLSGDWSKGPAGSRATDWLYGILGRTDLWSGQLAESWEIPSDQTIIYHIKKGIHWMNKPPVNGREMTADDLAWSIQSEWTTPNTNFDIFFKKEDRLISATATDKYTLSLKVPATAMGTNFLENSEREFMRAPEITKQYGNQNDWRNMNTTGPVYIFDYVPGSIITFKKNPSYWETDPVGPGKGNQLPYIDTYVQLIIPDASTRLAAFRIGKIDTLKSVGWEDGADLMKRNPALQSVSVFTSPLFLNGRVDKPNLPFKDVRVRRALNMAVNKQDIVDNYYKGHAELFGYPFPPTPAFSAFYTPLKDMPASVQEVFSYNPDKAKQLLADAGYPGGFKTKIVVSSLGTNIDYVAMIQAYLAKVGVDMQIDARDNTVYTTIANNRSNDEMIARTTTMFSLPYMMHDMRADSSGDASYWEDAQSLAAYQTMMNTLGRDDSKWVKALRDAMPDMLDNAWGIFLPIPYNYNIWWPWVKNFHGETSTGYARFNRNIRYLWIDQDLKKSMGH